MSRSPSPTPALRRPRTTSDYTPDLNTLVNGFSASDTPFFSGVSAPPTPALRDLYPGAAPAPAFGRASPASDTPPFDAPPGSGMSRAGAVAAMGALFQPGPVGPGPGPGPGFGPILPGPGLMPGAAAVVPVHGMLGLWGGSGNGSDGYASASGFLSMPASVLSSEFGGSSLTSSPDLAADRFYNAPLPSTKPKTEDSEMRYFASSGDDGDAEMSDSVSSPAVPRSSKARRQLAVDNATCSASQARSNRAAAVMRLRAKKRLRTEGSKVRYACRKKIAMVRPRINGRFATKIEVAEAARLGITLQ